MWTTERVDDVEPKHDESKRILPFAFRTPVTGSELQDSRILNIVTLVQREAPGVRTFAAACRMDVS